MICSQQTVHYLLTYSLTLSFHASERIFRTKGSHEGATLCKQRRATAYDLFLVVWRSWGFESVHVGEMSNLLYLTSKRER
jgi:hypothetical protein